MNSTLITPVRDLNSSSLEQTSLPGDDDQATLGSDLQMVVTSVLWMIVPPVLLVLGSYGNVMTIVVMRAMRASESTGSLSVYFTALAVSDLFVLWTNVLWYWPALVLNFPLNYFHDLSCTVPFFVSYVSCIASAWFLVAMTCQRMTSVVLPHRVEILCTARTGKIVIATIWVTSSLANVHIFRYFHLEYLEGVYPSCESVDKSVTNMFGYVYVCLASLIPFVFLIVTNSVLIRAALQSIRMSRRMAGQEETHASRQKAKVSSMTTTLILTSAAFLLLTLPTGVLWIYLEIIGYFEGEIPDESLSRRLVLVESVCMLMWISNSSINFYIYILSGRKFRQEAKRYLCPCFRI